MDSSTNRGKVLTVSGSIRLFNDGFSTLANLVHYCSIPSMHELTIEGLGTVEVEKGTRLVRAIEDAGVDIGHRCGGQAQCTTCRVQFKEGEPGVMTKAEYERLQDMDQLGAMRLSCQIVVDRDMEIEPLMTVDEQGWDDAGPEPAITVEPAAEWHPVTRLEQNGTAE